MTEFNFKENLILSKHLMSRKKGATTFTTDGGKTHKYEEVNERLRQNMMSLTHENGEFAYYKYQENKNTIFQLLSQTLTEVLPRNVYDTYAQFADVQTIPQGDRIVFTKKIGQQRALSFITRVALASRYEVFELAEEKYELKMTAWGAAARIPLEEFLDGRVQWSDYLDIINEGMARAVYIEISKALIAAIELFPDANKASFNSFDIQEFDRLIQTISVYGSPVIYGTYEALATLIPDSASTSDNMRDSYWANGRMTTYKGGIPMIVLPQSFVDETNALKVIDPSYIYIFPTNSEKPVKIAFEGQTLVKEFNQESDWSTTIHTYNKWAVAVMTTNNLGVYRNTSLLMTNNSGHPWPATP